MDLKTLSFPCTTHSCRAEIPGNRMDSRYRSELTGKAIARSIVMFTALFVENVFQITAIATPFVSASATDYDFAHISIQILH